MLICIEIIDQFSLICFKTAKSFKLRMSCKSFDIFYFNLLSQSGGKIIKEINLLK